MPESKQCFCNIKIQFIEHPTDKDMTKVSGRPPQKEYRIVGAHVWCTNPGCKRNTDIEFGETPALIGYSGRAKALEKAEPALKETFGVDPNTQICREGCIYKSPSL